MLYPQNGNRNVAVASVTHFTLCIVDCDFSDSDVQRKAVNKMTAERSSGHLSVVTTTVSVSDVNRTTAANVASPSQSYGIGFSVLFCSLAVLGPRVGHTMDVLSPFIPVVCHSG